jgi:primosomal protein DnaI
MKSLKEIINEIAPGIEREAEQLLQRIYHDEELAALITKHNIPEETLRPAIATLFQYMEERNNCRNCPGIENCPNLFAGHFTSINYIKQQFYPYLDKCSKQKAKDRADYQSRLFKGQHLPDELYEASLIEFDKTKGRLASYEAVLRFVTDYKPGTKQRGIYLYGPLGVGKSYMLVGLAKKLAERDVATLMVYLPDFFRDIKQSIGDDSLNQKIDALKNIEILILDDIGAESISQWERDEILGAILQARMVKGLPTIYSSNLDYDGLEHHLAYSSKGGEELLKAKRIMERIRHYTDAYLVDGPNRRK